MKHTLRLFSGSCLVAAHRLAFAARTRPAGPHRRGGVAARRLWWRRPSSPAFWPHIGRGIFILVGPAWAAGEDPARWICATEQSTRPSASNEQG